MFHPLPVFLGLRYVRARSHKFFVSFITWASLVGVCVGVAALIVILSVMNGFESELRERLLSLAAPVRVTARADATGPIDWQALARRVRGVRGVSAVARYDELQALAVRQPEMVPVLLRGIDPADLSGNAELARAVTQGRLADLVPGSDRVLVGAVIAERLGLAPGEHLTVLVPTLDASGAPAPKLREFTVAGVFEIGLQDHDGTLIFTHLADVQALGDGATALSEGLRVRVEAVLAANAVAQRVRAVLPQQLEVSDWTRDNANYFRAIRIEKTMMSLILLLIVAVAAFNIVAMLVMVVTDKRTDIAIVRTFGAAPRRVMGIFITQGLVIGWLGVLLGVGLGLLLAYNVGRIVPLLEQTFGFHIMDADVYYITAIPSEVHWSNVLTIGLAALILTALATVYPALRAAATAPAEALRYE
ncbi:MAG: lipoprotein-releasing ABC transporter permease subunit [Gammaproteobacteria bacterium]|nr:lipoprotein-releasing ABC transporter permease subunit [Gammaproteobacteria bacterium]MBV9697025.1 lipoprotein-releasing ABC transporter permease subunit [Gammaproteobacteria bacterium]